MAFLDFAFNPVLGPLINWNPFLGVFLVSFLISLIIVLVYKFFTNQQEMKRLKEEQKESQKKMKELRNNPEEMMKVQKEAMKKNLDYMKHSFKAMLTTMLPILLIFGWMNEHLTYQPIFPDETYSITASFKEGASGQAELIPDAGTTLLSEKKQEVKDSATWNLKSSLGEHFLTVKLGEEEQNKRILISDKQEYETPLSVFPHADITQIKINYQKLTPLKDLSLFGWKPGWLGIYIILSIVFSMGLRKLMKVY